MPACYHLYTWFIGVGAGLVGTVLSRPFFPQINNIHNQCEMFSERSFSAMQTNNIPSLNDGTEEAKRNYITL